MKKLILSAATLAMLCACGNKTENTGDADSAVVDSAVVDTIESVYEDTPEEVAAQVAAQVESIKKDPVKLEELKEKAESGQLTEQEKTLWEKLKGHYNDATKAGDKKDATGVSKAGAGAVDDVAKSVTGKDANATKKVEETKAKVDDTKNKINDVKNALEALKK